MRKSVLEGFRERKLEDLQLDTLAIDTAMTHNLRLVAHALEQLRQL